jgi:hypothetical protein
MGEHSVTAGGSMMARRLACTKALQLELKLPPGDDEGSEYAREGTAFHEAMVALLSEGIDPADLTGRFFYDRIITEDDVADCLRPALMALHELMAQFPDETFDIRVEQRVKVRDIPGAFGTSDIIAVGQTVVLIVDWKFGRGVMVPVLYPDAVEGDLLNPQLMFYLDGALSTYPKLFRGKRLVIAIVQPRADGEILDWTEVTRAEVRQYHKGCVAAIEEAFSPHATLNRGEHCRWCKAKQICPAWIGPMLSLHALKRLQPTTAAHTMPVATPYGLYMAEALAFADQVEPLIAEIRKQAHGFMDQGGLIPGYKLVAKRAYRSWIDPAQAIEALRAMGYADEEIFTEPELRSPPQVEERGKIAGRKPKERLPEEQVQAISSGTTVAFDTDARPPQPPRQANPARLQTALLALR